MRKNKVLSVAISKGAKLLDDLLGSDMDGWSWGKIQLALRHHVAGQPALASVLIQGLYPAGGVGTTIWAEFFSVLSETRYVTVGPPYRFIADLSDLDYCQGVLLPGQSGNPSSLHYADQVQDWLTGKYHPK